MATVSGTVNNSGLVSMVNGIANLTLALKAIDADDFSTLATETVTYNAQTVSNVINMNEPEIELTITGDHTVGSVQLWDTVNTELIATVTLTTDNDFPSGGKLIVTSYAIEANAV